jgi:hypothetical protein
VPRSLLARFFRHSSGNVLSRHLSSPAKFPLNVCEITKFRARWQGGGALLCLRGGNIELKEFLSCQMKWTFPNPRGRGRDQMFEASLGKVSETLSQNQVKSVRA